MDPIFGSLIGAGANILGSLLGGGETQSAGDVFRSGFKAKMKMGEKYGISKLVMAGANAGASPWEGAGSNLGESLGAMGADIGRAVASKQSAPQRAVTRLALEGAGLDNELKRAQIRSMNSRTIRESAPPLPVAKPGSILPHRIEPPALTSNYKLFGQDIQSYPGFSDGGVVTQRGGESELLETIMAPIILGSDVAYTVGQNYRNNPGASAARQIYDTILNQYRQRSNDVDAYTYYGQ